MKIWVKSSKLTVNNIKPINLEFLRQLMKAPTAMPVDTKRSGV